MGNERLRRASVHFDMFIRPEHCTSHMRVRDWQEIVRDVVESDAEPDEWRALAGPRNRGLGEDLYLAHPGSGVFLLKTYAKNPLERKGVGTQVARSLDEEIGAYLPSDGPEHFAVQPRPTSKQDAEHRARRLNDILKGHREGERSPESLFGDLMGALDSPAFGPLTYDSDRRPDPLDGLAGTFDEEESVLNAEVDDLIDEDGIGRGFG